MAEFDPAALLRQLRNKGANRAVPEPPPRPENKEDVVTQKLTQLENLVNQLQAQLQASQETEIRYREENLKLTRRIQELEEKSEQVESEYKSRIEELEDSLASERKKQKKLINASDFKSENRIKTPPPRPEIKKPAFSSAVSSNSLRYNTARQRGKLDLEPLMELYKIMPDFPRPVLQIDFTEHMFK